MPILDKNNESAVLRYNEFIRNSQYNNTTQDIKWSEVKADWENMQVYIEKDEKIVAAMSLLIKKFALGYYFVYCPKGPVCDPLDINTINELINEFEKCQNKYKVFLLRFDPELNYDESLFNIYKENGFILRNTDKEVDNLIQPIHNMRVYINGLNEEELLSEIKSKTRYNIRLAKRKGVEVRFSDEISDLKIFYELYKSMADRKGIGCRSYNYFENMLKAFKGSIRVYIASHDGEDLSGGVSINYGNRIFNIYNGSSNKKQNLMPNYLMQWEMIKWAIHENKEFYDFGGVFKLDKSDGLYYFKEKFCGEKGVVKFIGEIDKVYNPLMYKLFTNVVPRLQEIKKKINF